MANVVARIPARDGVEWTTDAAASAIGLPLLDRVVGGRPIGTVRDAYPENGDLVLTIELDGFLVDFDLGHDAVRGVSVSPKPRLR